MIQMDLHIHSVASGHGTHHTITELAKAASEKGMTAIGISDHGPATPGSCKESYFRNLKLSPRQREGIRLLYGIEANILDPSGMLDVGDETLKELDYVIASLHSQSYCNAAYIRQNPDLCCSRPFRQPVSASTRERQPDISMDKDIMEANLMAYQHVMENPYVRILGHPEDVHFPVNLEHLVAAAIKHRVILEINEASLVPGSYRGDTTEKAAQILSLCMKNQYPVLLSSDSHGSQGMGETPYASHLLNKIGFSPDLVLNNYPPEAFLHFRK